MTMTTHTDHLQSLSDDELLRRLSDLLSQSRRVEVDLIAHIAEVDHRRLYVSQACSSMFVYCLQVLCLSENEAYDRITAARASRRYPMLLEMLRDGRLHLSGIGKLVPHLTDENCEHLLARAAHKTKRQIEELVAEISPRPDVPPIIRKLPDARLAPPLPTNPTPELGPARVAPAPHEPAPPEPFASAMQPPSRPPVVRPLAPSRYQVSFTASAQFREKLERLQALMKEDLVSVLEAAVTEKLERLEARRYAETRRPRKSLTEADTSPKSRYIPAPVRRAIYRRDGGRCAFVDDTGRRCTETRGLEFHHHDPFGRGGDHDPNKISLRCGPHNLHAAEQDYGKEVMDRYRNRGGRVSESGVIYGAVPGLDPDRGFLPELPWYPWLGSIPSSFSHGQR